MDKLIITGAGGWLGKNFVQFAQDTFRLRCMIAPWENEQNLSSTSSELEWVKGDITNKKDCENLLKDSEGAFLVHLAGVIHPKSVKQFYSVNFFGTQNLLVEAKKQGIKRAVVMSSNSPLGVNPSPSHLFDETSPYHPYMHYGRSKFLMEQFVQGLDLKTVIVRSPWFYGPYQPERQALFFKMIRDGKMPVVGNGSNLRSMAYVDNISQGLVKALTSSLAAGKIYWIADSNPYSMNEIIETIENLLENDFSIPCRHRRVRLPNVVSEIAYSIDKCLQAVGVYNQKIHVLSELNKTIACSIQKARDELNYQPEYSLREGMRRSIEWAIKQGQLEIVK